MNRIRKVGDTWQVLITPNIRIAPDSPIIVGNWEDENLRNYYILEFDSLNDAQAEAFKYPDIDWHRFVLNHQPIFQRLRTDIKHVLDEGGFDVELRAKLMTPEEFKNAMFDRVLVGGERFNMKSHMNDLIKFTIVNPWSNVLHKAARALEQYRVWLVRDDLRIREKEVIDGKIINLNGVTEFGSVYQIQLIPTLLDQWANYARNNEYRNPQYVDLLYKKMLAQQNIFDKGPILI